MTREEIEAALKGGNLWARMGNGRLWVLRRNGQTKLWKRDATRFEIPVKAGLRACGRINENSTIVPDFWPSEEGKYILEQI